MAEAILLFPGQGSQSVGMGRDLYDQYPAARAVFDEADAALGVKLSDVIFDGPEEDLTLTPNAQPAVTTVNLAVLAVLREQGVAPAATAGHSLGEYAAAAAAGVFDVATAVTLTRRRGQLMQQCADAHPGSMVAVIGLDAGTVEELCREVREELDRPVSAANLNGPDQVVITGETEPVQRAAARLQEAGAKRTVELKVSGPWHSPLMEEAQQAFAEALDAADLQDPSLPLYANIDGQRKTTAAEVRAALLAQITGAVRWTELVRNLLRDVPNTPCVECGPGKVLKGLLRRIDRDATCLGVENLASLEAALKKLGG